jgi:WhiB family redox-sensing transcriptional regulator
LAPEVFYPDPEDDTEADIAKEVCSRCIVQAMCLEYALTHREKEGVWGGATERERRRIIRQRRRTA